MIRHTIISITAIIVASLAAANVGAQSKIDPFFNTLAHMRSDEASSFKASSLNGTAKNTVQAFIKTSDLAATEDAITRCGGEVRAKISASLITADIPADAVGDLEGEKSIVFIEAGKPITSRNDVAMDELGGNEVHEGLDLPQGYTGKGVIVGVIDTGIDLTHDDFLDGDGKSRIIYAWDQQGTGGRGPTELASPYGIECDGEAIASGACPMQDTDGHGTHVAGSAAGRDGQYGGVAPDADIIAVRYKSELLLDGYATPIFSTTICEAAFYIFKKAESLGKPAVINLSLGSHIGPHDGTSLFELCLDELVAGSSGRALVAAAGNEHISHTLYTGLHAGYDVSGTMATNFRIKSFDLGRLFYLDAWLSSGSNVSFGVRVRDTSSGKVYGTTDMIAPGGSGSGTLDGSKIAWQIDATETSSPLNGRPHVGITLVVADSVKEPQSYDFDLIVSGTGHFDAWWYPDKSSSSILFTSVEGSEDGLTYVPGDDRMNVAMPATARTVISVGGYASRTKWDKGSGCCQVAFTLGDILSFSSVGPSANPSYTGQKPEITAPGAMIASAKSSGSDANSLLDLSDGVHTLAAGTSMATAFVSGTVALMFSADPNYTYEDVRRYITESAYVDANVGSAPNDIWGYGKLDILSAVQTAVLGGPTGSAATNASLSAPDGGGSSSCTMIPNGGEMSIHMVPAILSVLSMVAVVWTARRKR